MKTIAYFDSGTTNTRIYLLQNRRILAQGKQAVGSKDTALLGNNRPLLTAMLALYKNALGECGLSDGDIEGIYVSGMASCPSGVVEVPHLPVPLSCRELAGALYCHREESYFHRDLLIVPGMKNIPEGQVVTPQNAAGVNNVRGEEIEVMGILDAYRESLPDRCAVVLPGSHTQTIFVENGAIVDLLATISGELFQAVRENTIIGSAVGKGGPIHEDMVLLGYETLLRLGFNRALYVTRTIQLFANCSVEQRSSYLEGVINGGVLQAIRGVVAGMSSPPQCLAVVGGPQFQVFSAICQKHHPEFSVLQLQEEGIPFSVRGLCSLLDHLS